LDIFFIAYGTCSSCAHDNCVIAMVNYRVLAGDCVLLHLQEAKKINNDKASAAQQNTATGLILIHIRI
jgi:hypothetical protein